MTPPKLAMQAELGGLPTPEHHPGSPIPLPRQPAGHPVRRPPGRRPRRHPDLPVPETDVAGELEASPTAALDDLRERVEEEDAKADDCPNALSESGLWMPPVKGTISSEWNPASAIGAWTSSLLKTRWSRPSEKAPWSSRASPLVGPHRHGATRTQPRFRLHAQQPDLGLSGDRVDKASRLPSSATRETTARAPPPLRVVGIRGRHQSGAPDPASGLIRPSWPRRTPARTSCAGTRRPGCPTSPQSPRGCPRFRRTRR